MKTIIRLTEGDLHRIVKESVKNILNEFNMEHLKALKDVENSLRSACAAAQYNDSDNAVRCVENAIEIATSNPNELSGALGGDNCQKLMDLLDAAIHPIPVENDQLLRLLRKAMKIVSGGYTYSTV